MIRTVSSGSAVRAKQPGTGSNPSSLSVPVVPSVQHSADIKQQLHAKITGQGHTHRHIQGEGGLAMVFV